MTDKRNCGHEDWCDCKPTINSKVKHKRNMKQTFNIKLFTTLAVLIGYIVATNQYFEYVINREVNTEIAMIVSWIWIMVSYYALKLVTANVIDLVKYKK